MIKAALMTLVIFVVCTLENIGHYFGFCFHGLMTQIVGGIVAFGFGLAMYFTNIKIWLNTRTNNRRKHMCKDHHDREIKPVKQDYDTCECKVDVVTHTGNCKVHRKGRS